jgi:hypothetical protein
MTTLTLVQEKGVTTADFSLRAFVESALDIEIQATENGLRRTQERIRAFEAQYGLSTDEFLDRYRLNLIHETLETIEWVGEQRMEQHLRNKLRNLRGIRVAD